MKKDEGAMTREVTDVGNDARMSVALVDEWLDDLGVVYNVIQEVKSSDVMNDRTVVERVLAIGSES